MQFKKYQHVEQLGKPEVDGILNGKCYLFPKLDGANASVWLNDIGNVAIGSRNLQLEANETFRGLRGYVENHGGLRNYLYKYPTRRLYGEWLIPHTIKNYVADAWKHFYVFDVMDNDDRYIPYEDYCDELLDHNIRIIKCFEVLDNPTEEQIAALVDRCTFLMQDNKPGEGIVIKNYDFVNRFGKTIWAKVVRNFKPAPTDKPLELVSDVDIEQKLVDQYITNEFIGHEYAKIDAINGWNKKYIGTLLNNIWHALIADEICNILKKYHNPTINFGRLNSLAIKRVKELQPDIFS